MKLIAVSQRIDVVQGRGERRDAIDQRLLEFLQVAGFNPIPVPNTLFGSPCGGASAGLGLNAWLTRIRPEAAVLSGGNDIGECPDRDRTETVLLDHAQQYCLPVLGICRGMQMMGVRAGGVLKSVQGHVHVRHLLQGSLLGEVNSYHNFSLAACPPGYTVLARAEDGEIEAIRSKTLPWQGWMWHPEREQGFSPLDIERTKDLLRG